MNTSILSRFVGAVLFWSIPFVGTSTVSSAADSSQPKDLRLFYQKNCTGCHGVDGAAVDAAGKKLRGQDFTDGKWLKENSDERMVKVTLKGLLFGFAMPAFKTSLTSEDAQRMAIEILRKCEKGKIIQPVAKVQ